MGDGPQHEAVGELEGPQPHGKLQQQDGGALGRQHLVLLLIAAERPHQQPESAVDGEVGPPGKSRAPGLGTTRAATTLEAVRVAIAIPATSASTCRAFTGSKVFQISMVPLTQLTTSPPTHTVPSPSWSM